VQSRADPADGWRRMRAWAAWHDLAVFSVVPPFHELGVTILGTTLNPKVAGAIFLIPPALIFAYGMYLLRTLPKDRL